MILFGKEELYTETMGLLMYELVSVTLHMCARLTENNQNRLSEQADVLDSFFSMMSQITKKNPKLLLSQGVDTTALFQCGKLSKLFIDVKFIYQVEFQLITEKVNTMLNKSTTFAWPTATR